MYNTNLTVPKNKINTRIKNAGATLFNNILKHPSLYLMILPVLAYYIIFCYLPMYGVLIAFENYNPVKGILGSEWVGFENFINFFSDRDFFRVFRNTLSINLGLLIFSFPLPIVFAILLNEIFSSSFRRVTQTITYMPHFVSSVVICGLLIDFVKSDGLLTTLFTFFGVENTNLLSEPLWFQPLFIGMNIWQEMGWDSIIFFAALTAIPPDLYEAAIVDGASRLKQILYITIPGIMPTVIILLILRIGNLMNLGWDRIILLYNPIIYETSDVISTLVYRRGLLMFDYSFGTAAGLFNSIINVMLLITANRFSRKVNGSSLW